MGLEVKEDIRGWTQQTLAEGVYGYVFANAGEIMRDYSGWARRTMRFFQLEKYPPIDPESNKQPDLSSLYRDYHFSFRRIEFVSRQFRTHCWTNLGQASTICLDFVGIGLAMAFTLLILNTKINFPNS